MILIDLILTMLWVYKTSWKQFLACSYSSRCTICISRMLNVGLYFWLSLDLWHQFIFAQMEKTWQWKRGTDLFSFKNCYNHSDLNLHVCIWYLLMAYKKQSILNHFIISHCNVSIRTWGWYSQIGWHMSRINKWMFLL